jgi:hypothetical protein
MTMKARGRSPYRWPLVLAIGSVLVAPPVRGAGSSNAIDTVSLDRSHDRPRILAGIGGALGFANLEIFGPGLSLHGGVDLDMLRLGPTRHRLLVTGEVTRFSRWGVDADFFFRGLQADVFAARADWRVYPFRSLGLHASAGSGLLVSRDRIALELPERAVVSSETRVGIPFELAAGWTIADRFDVSVRYTHGVYFSGASKGFGFLGLTFGVRL